jgi:hypothetical protein|tara:strand:+ start:3167 stop:4597 length:1431 start_codon:yes stop_codon:yes gene_type:complete
MSFIKKSILFTFIFSMFLSVAYAVSFDAEAVPIDNKIIIDEFATFQISIKNNLQQNDEYRIYSLDFPTWDVRTDPIVNPITLELMPSEEGNIEIVVDPLKIKDIGTYQVNINVKSKVTNELFGIPLKVSIMSTDPLIQGYVPTVVTSVGIPQNINPKEEVPIKIILNNQNIIDYPELIIKIESNLIKETITTQLGPKEEKTLELKANLDPLTEPQEDNLVVAIFKGDKSIINPIVRKIEIIEYAEKEVISEDKKFFLERTHYNFVSNNKDYEGKFKIETTLLGSIFSSTNPKTKIVTEDDKRYFVGDVKLENNAMRIDITKNFIPLFVVIILLIVVAISYYALRSPLLITKQAKNIVKKEGGVSEMAVILHIRNRSQDKIKDIEISEFIPALVSVGSDVPIGSLQPTKVLKHERKGSAIVKWDIDSLDASEERVLSYKIKSQLSILGSFSMPATKATFKSDNKSFTSSSNRLSISD